MRQVTLTIPDEFYAPFMKLVNALPFGIKIEKVPVAPKSKVSKAAKRPSSL